MPIRKSTTYGEIAIAIPGLSALAGGPFVKVRCGTCNHRLFDVHRSYMLIDGFERILDGSLMIERKCPFCLSLNDGRVTSEDGRRFTGPQALAGSWYCECGYSLGYVDDIRGRVRVTCRCKEESRVVAAQAIVVIDQEAIQTGHA